MLLDFNGTKVNVNISEEKSVVSEHTGASLSALEVRTTARGQTANDGFLSLINQAKVDGVTSVDENGTVQKRWKIGNSSWSYREGEPIYRHTLELVEVEELNLSSLTLGNMTVQPYEYEESFKDGALSIEAKAVLTESQHAQLKAMQKSRDLFPVIRHGINEAPRQMRFGLCYWSQQNAEYKHQLFLVEESEEKKPDRLASAFQWMRPLRNQVADNTATIDSLLTTLINKNILTEDEVANIRKEVSEHSWDVWYEFFRVEDVDEL